MSRVAAVKSTAGAAAALCCATRAGCGVSSSAVRSTMGLSCCCFALRLARLHACMHPSALCCVLEARCYSNVEGFTLLVQDCRAAALAGNQAEWQECSATALTGGQAEWQQGPPAGWRPG